MYCCQQRTITPQGFTNVWLSLKLGSLFLRAGLFFALLHGERQRVMQRAAMVQLLWQQQVDGLSNVSPPH